MSCDWSDPGHDPYRGRSVAAAVSAYDIPKPARLELIAKIRQGLSDGMIEITRDELRSAFGTATDLRDMHSGSGLCRGPVDRSAWPAGRVERALIYCAGEHCLAVPVVCGNVSRITWQPLPGGNAAPHWAGEMRKTQPAQVPEPSSLLLAALGVAAAIGISRRFAWRS